MLADFVLQVATIWLLNPLRQVAEEDERRHVRAFEHGDVFDFDEFAFVAWRRICVDVLAQLCVELRSGHGALTVLVDLHGDFQHLEDALFGERR